MGSNSLSQYLDWMAKKKEEYLRGISWRNRYSAKHCSIEGRCCESTQVVANWKSPGLDEIHGFGYKSSLAYTEVGNILNRSVETANIPDWTVESETVLFQKDPRKGKTVENFKPITCLHLIRKLITRIIAENFYDHIDQYNLLSDEQKGYRGIFRGTKDQIVVDKTADRNCKKRKSNLNVA